MKKFLITLLIFIIAFLIGFYLGKQLRNTAKYFDNKNVNNVTIIDVVCDTKDNNQIEIEAILRL